MATVILMSSQRFIDDEIVEAKRAAQDYTVTISPVFEYEGELYQVVLDGHHRLAAAKIDGVEPNFVETDKTQDDNLGLLERSAELFLEAVHMDSDWYDVATGRDIW